MVESILMGGTRFLYGRTVLLHWEDLKYLATLTAVNVSSPASRGYTNGGAPAAPFYRLLLPFSISPDPCAKVSRSDGGTSVMPILGALKRSDEGRKDFPYLVEAGSSPV